MGSGKIRGKGRGDFTRSNPKPDGKVANAAGVSPNQLDRLDKLPPGQKQAIENLQLGRSNGAGMEFKQHKSQPDSPTVDQRPPMPNESPRTDMDRHGGRKDN